VPLPHPAAHLLALLRADSAALPALSPAEWEAVLELAAAHSLTPLLYYRLHAVHGSEALPPNAWQRLQEHYYRNTGLNIRRYHELARILTALQDAGVPPIALKGAHLAALVYEQVGLRPMVDVDLLAHEADLERADSALRAIGYVKMVDPTRFAEERSHVVYAPPPNGMLLELHHRLEWPMAPFRIDHDGLWARAESTDVAGVSSLVLSPEDLLLHLCLHAAVHHSYSAGLRPLCDIAAATRAYQPRLDWEALVARAREWQATHCVYLTLRLAQELLGADVPISALHALAPADMDSRLVVWATERVLTPGQSDLRALGELWVVPAGASKLALYVKAILPPRRWLAQRYGVPVDSWCVYLYYIVRLRDLIWPRLIRAWQRWRRDPVALAQAAHDAETRALVEWLIR